MQQPNFTTPPPHAVATPEGRHRYRIGTTPPAHHGSTPSCFYPQRHAPNTTPAPQPTLRADALFSLCRSPYPWLHPLLPLLALARVKGWRTVCDGDLKEGDEGSDSATPTPTPTPPRRSLPLRTSDGRAVDRVHRAWSLPTASVRAGARANSRAHRSEARTWEVSTVLRSSGSVLGTLAPRNATPPHHALAPPARARAPTAPAIQPPPGDEIDYASLTAPLFISRQRASMR